MKNPLVSVVTVCYNAKATIEGTMLSVLNQSYENIEYIVVDGGSYDGTVEIINRYKDKLTCFISEKDKGIYDAMNKGIKAATGEWILFRNSGDYFADKDVVKNMFIEEIDDNVIVLHGDCRVFDKYGYTDKKPAILEAKYNAKVMPVFHPSTFVSLPYHKKNLFNLHYKSSSDFVFFTKCTLNGCRYFYKPVLVSVMNVGEGMSVDNLKLVYQENYELLCENSVIEKSLSSKWSYLRGYYNMRFRYWMKNFLPKSIVEKKILKNKKMAGWVLSKNPIPEYIYNEK